MSLIEPEPLDEKREAIEHCELMLEESIDTILAIENGKSPKKPSFRGHDYDAAYAQGRKDACRVILICLGQQDSEAYKRSTDDVRRERGEQ